jgi:tetratricopeptide (TPR) repeat protein
MQGTAGIPQRWIYLLLVLLSFVLYGNSIRNDYCLDDNFVVTENPYVREGFSGILDILNKPYAKIGSSTLDFRPIVLVTFAIEYQFVKDNPHVSHFINILLYALCLVLIYKVLTRIFKLQDVHSWLPLLIIFLYAVHPIHSEVVNSLKNRDELLVIIFGMLFLLYSYAFYTEGSSRKKNAALSFVFLALALLSKITSVVFVGIFLLIVIYNRYYKGIKWNWIFAIACILLMFRGMYVVLVDVKRVTIPFENPLQDNKDLLIGIGTSLKILLYHLRMLIYPFPLRFYYGYNMFPLSSLADPYAIISLLIHVSLFVYGVVKFFKKEISGLLILCYFTSVVLYSNFPVPYTGMFSERTLLFSSLWFISILALAGFGILNKLRNGSGNVVFRYVASAFLLILFVGYSVMTIQRNFFWKNNLVLMEHDIPYLRHSVLSNYMYANNLRYQSTIATDSATAVELGRKAVKYYKHTIRLYPTYPETFFRLASVYRYNLKEYDKAEKYLKKAISLDSLYFNANFELAKLYYDQQDIKNSYVYFAKTYASNPKDSLTLFYYAQIATAAGDMNTTYKINKEFLQLYPDMQYPYMNMGKYYSQMRKDDTAVLYFEKAIERGARSPDLLKQMAIYYEKKDPQKAAYYQKMLPDHPR